MTDLSDRDLYESCGGYKPDPVDSKVMLESLTEDLEMGGKTRVGRKVGHEIKIASGYEDSSGMLSCVIPSKQVPHGGFRRLNFKATRVLLALQVSRPPLSLRLTRSFNPSGPFPQAPAFFPHCI